MKEIFFKCLSFIMIGLLMIKINCDIILKFYLKLEYIF